MVVIRWRRKREVGTDYMPEDARIVRLGKDLISLDSEIVEIKLLSYMTSHTPLDTDNWQYVDNYFKNPGDYSYDKHYAFDHHYRFSLKKHAPTM